MRHLVSQRSQASLTEPRASVSPDGRDLGDGRMKDRGKDFCSEGGRLLSWAEDLCHPGRGTLSLLGGDKGRRGGAGRGSGWGQRSALSVAEEARWRPEPQEGRTSSAEFSPGPWESREASWMAESPSPSIHTPSHHCTAQRCSRASRKRVNVIQVSEENSAWSNL